MASHSKSFFENNLLMFYLYLIPGYPTSYSRFLDPFPFFENPIPFVFKPYSSFGVFLSISQQHITPSPPKKMKICKDLENCFLNE